MIWRHEAAAGALLLPAGLHTGLQFARHRVCSAIATSCVISRCQLLPEFVRPLQFSRSWQAWHRRKSGSTRRAALVKASKLGDVSVGALGLINCLGRRKRSGKHSIVWLFIYCFKRVDDCCANWRSQL